MRLLALTRKIGIPDRGCLLLGNYAIWISKDQGSCPVMTENSSLTYEQRSAVWSENKRRYHAKNPPDWQYLRELSNYWIFRRDLE